MSLKIIVVGAGIGGLTLGWSFAKRGYRVEIFDQGPIPNPVSASSDEHRIACHNYGALDGYARMMPKAFAAYEALFRDIGARHYLETGLVFIRRSRDDWYQCEIEKLRSNGISHRELPEAEIRRRLPMLQSGSSRQAFEFGGAGLLFPQPILTDLAAWLTRAGVVLHAGRRVAAIDPELGRIIVDGRTHSADVVVVAAGAWLGRLAPEFAEAVRPSRQTILFLEPPEDFRAAWSAAPILVEDGGAHPGYLLPPRGATRLKIGGHHFSRYGDVDDDRTPAEGDIAPVMAVGAQALIDFNRYRLLEAKANYIAATKEERFIVRPLGRAGWVVSACAGHGFKLAPLIAGGVAAAIAGEREASEVEAWAAAR